MDTDLRFRRMNCAQLVHFGPQGSRVRKGLAHR